MTTLRHAIEWALSDWTHLAIVGAGVASGYSIAWGAVRASIERVTGKPLPRTRVVILLDILADLAINVPSAVNRVLRATGATPLFLPSSKGNAAEIVTPPPSTDPEAGRPTITPQAPSETPPP